MADAFSPATPDDEVLFELPVTKAWLRQVIVGLTLICRGSYRGVVEFLRDLLGVPVSVGCVHDVLQAATRQAGVINHDQDLSGSRVGLHDEIFQGATSRRRTLQAKTGRAGHPGPADELAIQLALARQAETQAHELARDFRTLTQWLRHDVLALAGPALATRQARPAFAGVLDDKLAAIAQTHAIPGSLVREACMLHRLPSTSSAYWQGWNRLRATRSGKFHTLFDAVSRAMADTPRSSSRVENLNSRLRTYFTLRRHLGGRIWTCCGSF